LESALISGLSIDMDLSMDFGLRINFGLRIDFDQASTSA